jgi:hypothetical protein
MAFEIFMGDGGFMQPEQGARGRSQNAAPKPISIAAMAWRRPGPSRLSDA